MTLHIAYDHECARCGTPYVPYDVGVACPQCGRLEDAALDFIPQAVASLRYNKESGGSYTPGAWWIGSFGDRVLIVLGDLLDSYEAAGVGTDFELWLGGAIAAGPWPKQDYLCDHIAAIARRVWADLGAP